MKILEWMKRTFSDYGSLSVKVLCMPLPPSPVRGLIYMPDCFTSKTFDREFDRSEKFRAVAMEATDLGPAVLAVVKLKDLIGFNADGYLTVRNATCCATISYRILYEEGGLKYAYDVQLDKLAMPTGSCHPGSHYAVPDAPFLTSLLQYAQAPFKSDKEWDFRIVYTSPDEGKAIFQNWDFHGNRIIDSYVARCAVQRDVSFIKIDRAIGKWAWPFLKELRMNSVSIKEASYERWFERTYETIVEKRKTSTNPGLSTIA